VRTGNDVARRTAVAILAAPTRPFAMSLDRYLQRIRVCHTIDEAVFEPWFVHGHEAAGEVGRVHQERVPLLLAAETGFVRDAGRLVLRGDDFAARSRTVANVHTQLVAAGRARGPAGEMYPVPVDAGGAPLLQLDRAVVTWFGVRAQGVHLNGFVRTATGLAMWVARRARGKRTFPGHLDNLVAGGQSIGLEPMATLQKECHEEAGIGAELAARACAVGELHYVHQDGHDRKADTLHCFDLELPATFVPQPIDGEVETFELWPVAQVAASLRGDDVWKPNCALVVLHFLLRHGALHGELDDAARARLEQALLPEGS
jgi:8-oxo-dGTP pyrophosphatase MutT (NUDIX family)